MNDAAENFLCSQHFIFHLGIRHESGEFREPPGSKNRRDEVDSPDFLLGSNDACQIAAQMVRRVAEGTVMGTLIERADK